MSCCLIALLGVLTGTAAVEGAGQRPAGDSGSGENAIKSVRAARDPIDGTWELDAAASKFNPGPGRKRDVRTYKVDGNTLRMTSTVVHADGKVENIQFNAALDSKDHAPTGNPRVETIAQERVDSHTIKTTTKRGGIVTATSVRQVSKDGKTLTITTTGTDEKGVAFNNTLVFRKRGTK